MHKHALFVCNMKKTTTIVIALIGVIIGAAIGTNTSGYFARQHEKTTAVMVMLNLHQHQWEAAMSNKDCVLAASELQSMQWLAREIAVALPLADKQDAVFHQYVQKMSEVLSSATVNQCPGDTTSIKQVREVCDDCHREYR